MARHGLHGMQPDRMHQSHPTVKHVTVQKLLAMKDGCVIPVGIMSISYRHGRSRSVMRIGEAGGAVGNESFTESGGSDETKEN